MVGVSKNRKQVIHGVDDLPDAYEHWIIKFVSGNDPEDNGSLEYAYSLMAREAGINMPETHLFPSSKNKAGKNKAGYFGVRRFDREGNDRIHMHTVSGLLHADHRMPSLDYEGILKTALVLTKSVLQVEQFFRLAAFNVFAYNRDDHAKNFSFLMDNNGAWRVAPAYDLVFSSGPGGEHSTTVMGEGRNPGTKDLLRLARKFDLKKAAGILDEVASAVRRWKDFADKAGVANKTARAIQGTLDKIT
jgi:serine/threonine-protein kinase HipA